MGNEWIIVKSKVKEITGAYNVSVDFHDALNHKVKEMVKEAMKRAEANQRKTVMARDL
jgi:histone H3/H4